MRGRLFPVEGDWYEWRQEPALAAPVLVRVTVTDDGRLVLAGLRIDGPPTAELLRALPVGRIEAAANAQLAVVNDAIVPAPIRSRPRPKSPPREAVEGWETTDPAGAARRPHPARANGPSRGRPDFFYLEIAQIYLEYAQGSHRPAVDLAGVHSVPVSTAHRWIKEARRRGFLPPGRPGKAG